ncbi:DUF1934 domain-containing protein [Terrisporobacter hibernicus]|uniref:DUF1934 domain-containing protein n=1 Tax=Terrisporobacter hibernicus TaxID=2813371 RepID=A0AAX2ZN16_9FIRM|nr:DUF1934 domain-containing protein [Terrisporobacter hibernicus]UEL49650.1 DUF1934 domain-containing protein [Terrisporobacter hibernicus]
MEVKINIHTIQYNEYGEKNDIKLNATGTLYEKRDNTYVVYREKEDGKETTTSIKIENDKITIKRFGEINSTMIFKENQKINSNYTTPQGMFNVETKTTNLSIKNEENIIIEIDYNIEIIDMFKGRNKIKINIYQ